MSTGSLPPSRHANAQSFDIDSSNNILTGGAYSDGKLFVGYFEPGFLNQWISEFTGTSKIFSRAVKFEHNTSPSNNVMATFLNSDSYGASNEIIILLLNRASGTIIK